MKYSIITRANAKSLYDLRSEGRISLVSNYVGEAGEGEPFDVTMVAAARRELFEIKDRHPDGRTPGKEFDAAASVALHRYLKIPPAMAADADFWRWLAFAEFAEIVDWRHPGKSGLSKPENYGIGTIWNNLMARLWFRSEIAYLDTASDPYVLARKGDVDLWRSHILRVNPGSCRNYVRALIRFQYPDGKTARLAVDEIREFAKRVRRLQATVALELLSEDDAFSFVERLAAAVQAELANA